MFIILVIISSVFYLGYYVPKYHYAKVISENSYLVISCSDTDGRDMYVKGYTNYKRDEPGESDWYESPDYCESHPSTKDKILREGWCEGLTYKEIRTTCGYGRSCVDGACI